MLRSFVVALMAVPMMAMAGNSHSEKHECLFAPENDMNIPITQFTGNGMTEDVFNSILTRIDKHYRPIVEGMGKTFDLQKDWNDGTVNAYAQQQGNTWIIKMFGGLARHEKVTPDGFALVACHEMGHHLAGAPRVRAWASNEGQSDYFATTKCARRIWAEDDNVTIMEERISQGKVSEKAKQDCIAAKGDPQERALCLRSAMAGLALGNTLASLGRQGETKIETPDNSTVSRTNDRHPKGQCRTDTYFQGALCEVAFDIDFDSKDHAIGACTRAKGHENGVRPLCWYKPPGAGDSDNDDGGGGGQACPFGDQNLCDQLCRMNPNYPFCKGNLKFY